MNRTSRSLAAALALALATQATPSDFSLKGNVQLQGVKSLHDQGAQSALDKGWARFHLGADYAASDIKAEFNLRLYPAIAGITYADTVALVKDSTGKITAVKTRRKTMDYLFIERAVVDFPVAAGVNARLGRFPTDYSVAGIFGNYLDQDPGPAKALSRPYWHDGAEFNLQWGDANTAVLVGALDSRFNTGYLRVVQSYTQGKQGFRGEAGWRANLFDSLAIDSADATLRQRIFTRLAYTLPNGIMPYAEAALLNLDAQAEKQGLALVGLQLPVNASQTTLNAEVQYYHDRQVKNGNEMEDRALDWNLGVDQKIAKRHRAQLWIYSDGAAPAITDVAVALRWTSSVK